MAVARNASRKARQRSQDPAESLINLSNERLTGLFRWTLLIFAVILNNLNPAAGYDQGRINAILAAWGVVCLTTLLLLFLHQRPGRAFSYTTTGVDMLVATMVTYASGGYDSPFAVLFFLVITVSALRFGAGGSVLCALLVAVLFLTAGGGRPVPSGWASRATRPPRCAWAPSFMTSARSGFRIGFSGNRWRSPKTKWPGCGGTHRSAPTSSARSRACTMSPR